MNPVTSWRDKILGLHPHPDPIVLTHPQPNFDYPDFPSLGAEDDADPIAGLTARLQPPLVSARIHLFAELSSAFEDWVLDVAPHGGALAGTGPIPPEFFASRGKGKGSLEHVALEREPSDLLSGLERLGNRARGLYLSNPNRMDGFFYPQEMYEDLYTKVRAAHPELPILSEESLGLFSFNQVAPGTLAGFVARDPLLTLASSVYPAMSPQGPETSWLVRAEAKLRLARTPRRPTEADARVALQALSAFQSRHGKGVAEFSRRMLAVDRGMKTLGVHLQRLNEKNLLQMGVWPETGFHLTFAPTDLTGGIERWCVRVFDSSGVLLIPGTLFGRPSQAALCYAAPVAKLEEAGRRISLSLQADGRGGKSPTPV